MKRLLFAFALAGCTSSAAVESTTVVSSVALPQTGGTTTITAVDNLDWPYAMSRLVVAVDGVPVYNQARDLRSREVIAVLELEPGSHTLQVLLRASYASTPLAGGDCLVEMHSAQGIQVGEAAGRVDLDAHLDNVMRGFFERVDLDVRVSGGARSIDGPLESNPPKRPADVMAFLRESLRQARMNKDTASLACYEEKHGHAVRLNKLREKHNQLSRSFGTSPDGSSRIDDKLKELFVEALFCDSAIGSAPHGESASYANARFLVDDGDLKRCVQHPTNENGRPAGDRPFWQH